MAICRPNPFTSEIRASREISKVIMKTSSKEVPVAKRARRQIATDHCFGSALELVRFSTLGAKEITPSATVLWEKECK